MAFAVLGDLFRRRVPQIFGIYLGASWVIVEFVNLLVDRFALSPHLIEFSLVLLASLIPTVLMLAFFHGLPGRNEWATVEKIGIPVNLLGAAVLVGFLFSDRHLGAATTRVLVKNEEGRTVERVIPRSEFRKKVALFAFVNESADAALDWLQFGLTYGLQFDLMQDIYVHLADWHSVREQTERAQHPEGSALPTTLQANIADQLHRDYFVNGSFSREGEALAVTVYLYETRRQKMLAKSTFKGDDVLGLIDRMSAQLRRDLGIPDRHIEDTPDLRVADLLTHSREAFRLQAEAVELLLDNRLEAVEERMKRAVDVDPTSAMSHYFLSMAYLVTNRKEEADASAQYMMEYLYRLPELWQYWIKRYYYEAIETDAHKRFAVTKLMVDLFPEDIDSRVQLAAEYSQRRQMHKAIAEYDRILEIDSTQHEYLKWVGYAYRSLGEFDKALRYFERYAKAEPGEYSAFQALADVYCSRGEYERAESYYERALIIDPENVEVLGRLAIVAFNMGRLAESQSMAERALEVARTSQERATAYDWLSYYHAARHQIAKAIEYKELEWAERERHLPRPMVMANYILNDLDLYVSGRQAERAFEIIENAENELPSPFNVGIPSAYLDVYLALEDADKAQAALGEVEAIAEETAAGWAKDDLLAARGRIHELRGEYEQAIESYKQALKLEPLDITRHRSIGRSYRMLGQLKKAEAALKENLKVTRYNPKSHYEIAMVYADMGDEARALEHLRTAMQVLEDADPTCEMAQKTRAKLAELEAA